MKRVRVHPDAKVEVSEALDWYWQRSYAAGDDLDTELRTAFVKLQQTPNACSPYLKGTRRILLHRFPYSVIFRELPRKIEIIALAHAKRRPAYWSNRL